MFNYEQRPTTKDFTKGMDLVEKAKNDKCPNCNAFISEGDKVCWVCKKELKI